MDNYNGTELCDLLSFHSEALRKIIKWPYSINNPQTDKIQKLSHNTFKSFEVFGVMTNLT